MSKNVGRTAEGWKHDKRWAARRADNLKRISAEAAASDERLFEEVGEVLARAFELATRVGDDAYGSYLATLAARIDNHRRQAKATKPPERKP